jgi:hypothetical protein
MNTSTARMVGALILLATIAYGTGNGLVSSILDQTDSLRHVNENQTRVITGIVLMLVNSAAVIGIGVLMVPILKPHSETVAMAYLASRIVEGIVLLIGGLSLFSLIPLGLEAIDAGSTDTSTLQFLATLAEQQNRFAFHIAMVSLGIGSLFLCAALYQTQLIPRWLSAWGFVGYAALLTGSLLEVFGFAPGLSLLIPGGLFELILPFWLFVKGFNTASSAPINASRVHAP